MTGAAIQPIDAVSPQTGDSLNQFLQPWLVAMSTLPGNMVRPAFQADPPNIPDAGEAWMAFRYSTRPADDYPYFGAEFGAAARPDVQVMQRHEMISVLCSFFDLGIGGQADALATLTRDNIAVPQNVEVLSANNMGIANIGTLSPIPVIVKNRWQYRVDFPFTVRREIIRTYPVPSVAKVVGTVNTGSGLIQPFHSP